MLEENQNQKHKKIRPRKIVKRDIAENQFMTILKKVCRPIGIKTNESALKRGQTSGSRRSDGYSGKRTRSSKTVGTLEKRSDRHQKSHA